MVEFTQEMLENFFARWKAAFGYISKVTRRPTINAAQKDVIERIIRTYFEEVAEPRNISERLAFNQLAYILATAYHETKPLMVPVREGYAKTDRSAARILQREFMRRHPSAERVYNRSLSYGYAFPHPLTGQLYYGRGLVQLTWYDNYVYQSKVHNVDFSSFPDLVMETGHAVKILVHGIVDGHFVRRRDDIPVYTLSSFVNEDQSDYINARRLVNGTDRATMIAEYASSIHHYLVTA